MAVSNYNMTELLVKTRCNISGKNSKRFASIRCTVGAGRGIVSPSRWSIRDPEAGRVNRSTTLNLIGCDGSQVQ